MSKKIKISLKESDNLAFYIDENANEGDYFSLNDFSKISLDVIIR